MTYYAIVEKYISIIEENVVIRGITDDIGKARDWLAKKTSNFSKVYPGWTIQYNTPDSFRANGGSALIYCIEPVRSLDDENGI